MDNQQRPQMYRKARPAATRDFDLDRLDRVLTGFAFDLLDNLKALGFDDRDAAEAAFAALNAATDSLERMATLIEGGRA